MKTLHTHVVALPLLMAVDARQMASAPRAAAKPAEQPTASVEPPTEQPDLSIPAAPLAPVAVATGPVNRYDTIFTGVIFKAAASDKVYDQNGTKQKKLASVLVEVAGSRGYLKASVYAEQAAGQSKPRAVFKFFGSQTGVCFTTDDPQSAADLNAWKANQCRMYADWRKASNGGTLINVPSAQDVEIEGLASL